MRREFLNCNLHVDLIEEDADAGATATPDEVLVAENEALKARLAKAEEERDAAVAARDKAQADLAEATPPTNGKG